MLDDYRATVDANYLAVGECVGDYSSSLGIEVGLRVGGIEHCPVDDEEIGIGGRQTLGSLLGMVEEVLAIIVYRTGRGQSEQTIAPAALSLQLAQVFLHFLQRGILLVVLVVAPHL